MCSVLYQSKIPRGGKTSLLQMLYVKKRLRRHKLERLLVQAKASRKVKSVIREHGLNTDMEKISTMNPV